MLVGIIGKPNTGKSTFFNAATLLNVAVAPYPFTTISPNLGVGYLRVACVCKKLRVQDNPVNSVCIDGNRFIPVKLVDVAGLVPGASKGRGLGNKFLDEIRQADALIQVVDSSGSTDEEGRPCPRGGHDPLEDIEFVEREFDLWLTDIIAKDWPKISRAAEAGNIRLSAKLAERLSGLSINEAQIDRAIQAASLRPDRPTGWGDEGLLRFSSALRSIAKPSLIAANKADLPGSDENIKRIRESGRLVVPCVAEAELLLRRAAEKRLINYLPGDPSFQIRDESKLTPQQKRALQLIEEKVLRKWGSTGVQQAINSAYLDLLESIVVYPVQDESRLSDKHGNVLPDAKVLRKGATAKDLAYAIHTDLGDSFIYAIDVLSGRRIGADHVLKDSDVIKIVAAAKRA